MKPDQVNSRNRDERCQFFQQFFRREEEIFSSILVRRLELVDEKAVGSLMQPVHGNGRSRDVPAQLFEPVTISRSTRCIRM